LLNKGWNVHHWLRGMDALYSFSLGSSAELNVHGSPITTDCSNILYKIRLSVFPVPEIGFLVFVLK